MADSRDFTRIPPAGRESRRPRDDKQDSAEGHGHHIEDAGQRGI